MFDFKEKFKSSDSVDLFRMLAHPEKFQPDAIAAAQFILDERKHNEPEKWQTALDQLEHEKELTDKKSIAVASPPLQDEEDVNNIWVEDEIEIKNRELAWNQVLVICFILLIILFKDIYFTLRLLFIYDRIAEGLFKVDPILITLDLINIATILFLFKKDKIGWTLLIAQSIFTLFSSLLLAGYFFYKSYNTNNFSFPFSFYTTTSSLIVYGVMLRQALQPRMTKLFQTNAKWTWIIGAIVLFLYCCYVFGAAMGRH